MTKRAQACHGLNFLRGQYFKNLSWNQQLTKRLNSLPPIVLLLECRHVKKRVPDDNSCEQHRPRVRAASSHECSRVKIGRRRHCSKNPHQNRVRPRNTNALAVVSTFSSQSSYATPRQRWELKTPDTHMLEFTLDRDKWPVAHVCPKSI